MKECINFGPALMWSWVGREEGGLGWVVTIGRGKKLINLNDLV